MSQSRPSPNQTASALVQWSERGAQCRALASLDGTLDLDNGASDHDLLARFVGRGDADALGMIAARYERALLGLAKGLLSGREPLACEAVQGAWVKVIRYGRSFEGTSSVKTWLYRIVINQCRDVRRREAKQAQRTVEARTARPALDARSAMRPVAAAEQCETRDLVAAAVARLPDAQREIVLLCYHADLTHAQASEILMIPAGTLKSRLHSALTSLREALPAERVA